MTDIRYVQGHKEHHEEPSAEKANQGDSGLQRVRLGVPLVP